MLLLKMPLLLQSSVFWDTSECPLTGLLLLLGCPKVDYGTEKRTNQRLDSSEGCSGGRGSLLHPGEGFCLVQPAKSAPQSPLVNKFAVLNVEEVNTNIYEPIDALLPSALDRKALSWRLKQEKNYPNNFLPILSMPIEHLSSFLLRSVPLTLARCILSKHFQTPELQATS